MKVIAILIGLVTLMCIVLTIVFGFKHNWIAFTIFLIISLDGIHTVYSFIRYSKNIPYDDIDEDFYENSNQHLN